jgi:D-tagatose-1,6-bisphosphate aldolase subunit GatZ/KbaZ
MQDLDLIIKKLISRNARGEEPITLLAVCPNSSAVLEAAVKVAARKQSVMLFAATLNQVDYEDSYTGWTPADFVDQMKLFAEKYQWNGPLYPCLDHGGPWLKDLHTLDNLTYLQTMEKVKDSVRACIQAGYRLLHIDPTVDRSFPTNQALPLDLVVDRTVELIAHAEQVRAQYGNPKVSYEVGTEEVHGGLVDINRFESFLRLLKQKLAEQNLIDCWPCLFVAQIGTDLHTTQFKPDVAAQLNAILAPTGSMVKGHYTDWVENPEQYPASQMGAANIGPEFTAEEFDALVELEELEKQITKSTDEQPSHFFDTLQHVVVTSGRWKKWLLPREKGLEFNDLTAERKEWLLKTGSRYIWTNEKVAAAREILYHNLKSEDSDPNDFVINKIASVIEKYIWAFNLQDSIAKLGLNVE